MRAGVGSDAAQAISATIFSEDDRSLPVRLVALSLRWPGRKAISVEHFQSEALLQRLNELNRKFLDGVVKGGGGIYYQRVARVYSPIRVGDDLIPTVFLIKPDRIRYWTRSAAQRDADAIAADAMLAAADGQQAEIIGVRA